MWVDNDDDLDVDECGFIIHVHGQNVDRYKLTRRPGRTNRSGDPRLKGWLGETNNVNLTAVGVGCVTRLNATHERACVRLLNDRAKLMGHLEATFDELSAALEDLGFPEMCPGEIDR